ncbi:phage integrase SAM-like domain-containing protein [Paenactinomyces guangxiensis]|uniref:Phage integrase SAM-like domain-containing protein n=1 Tax=Paenactinomyces guangxiensis TaxID=1490290 RepID=A0A7W1WSJ6_9BACL|nr:phage integrase SAM-like domain-containing protein [Paenactinomyces guangxiensis]MBH8592339.1 phage integrase SAM-like domain-containing protein [Paenactinomyces guangxiensis]
MSISEKRTGKNVVRKRGKSHVRNRHIEKVSDGSHALKLTFREALDIFVQAKKSEGVRPRTLSDYRQHMKYLAEFLTEFYPEINVIQDLTTEIIHDYIIYLKDRRTPYSGIENRERAQKGLSANTINIRLRTLRTMSRTVRQTIRSNRTASRTLCRTRRTSRRTTRTAADRITDNRYTGKSRRTIPRQRKARLLTTRKAR